MYYLRKEPYEKLIMKDGEKPSTLKYESDRAMFKDKRYNRMYRMDFRCTDNQVKLWKVKNLQTALKERVRLWWYCHEWFDIYDSETNKPLPNDVYLKYKPSPLGTYYTTRTLYYSEEEGEIVDDKPKYGYYETYRVGTVLKVYKWLDWYQEWDFYQNSTYEEFSTMIEKIILVTNKGKHLFTYNDIYELQDEECAWIESKWDKELREVK